MAYRNTVTAKAMNCAGIILVYGAYYLKKDPIPSIPEWTKFMEGCVRYRQSLDKQLTNAPRKMNHLKIQVNYMLNIINSAA